jgi:thiol-disulfide isomerase/thioredoxin
MLVALSMAIRPGLADEPAEQTPSPPAEATAKDIPAETLEQLAKLITPPFGGPGLPPDQQRRKAIEQMAQAIRLGREALADYPDAANHMPLRQIMLQAAGQLYEMDAGEVSRERLRTMSLAILDASSSPAESLPADIMLTMLAVRKSSADADLRRRKLVELVEKYADTPSAAGATMNAAGLAGRHGLKKLFATLADDLQQNHLDDGEAVRFLARIGRTVPFRAKLTTLAGKELSLPDDLKGKVLVVEFWATWCPQCRLSRPYMRQLHKTYKDRGVQFVGISLDKPDTRAELKAYIAENQLDWTHTYSGQGISDRTFVHYRLDATPAAWVIDRQGNIVTDDAYRPPARPDAPPALENINRHIERALRLADNGPANRPEPGKD